jgi:hypothetical protein
MCAICAQPCRISVRALSVPDWPFQPPPSPLKPTTKRAYWCAPTCWPLFMGLWCYLRSIIFFDTVMPVKIGWVASKTGLTVAHQNLGANRDSGDLVPPCVGCQYWTILMRTRAYWTLYVAHKLWNVCSPSLVKHSWESQNENVETVYLIRLVWSIGSGTCFGCHIWRLNSSLYGLP